MTSSLRFLGLTSALLLLAACDHGVTPTDGGGTDSGTGSDGPGPGTDAGDAMTPPGDMSGSDAGSDAGSDPVPAFRTPLPTISDDDLARQALAILGAPEAGATRDYCNNCHTLSRQRIRFWRALSDTSMHDCLTDLNVSGGDTSAAAMLACLRDPARDDFTPEKLGIWSTAAGLDWFQYVFRHGTAAPTDWMAAHTAFVSAAGMPRMGVLPLTPMSQSEFDIVAEWFLRGVPNVDDVLPVGSAPTECLPGVSADAVSHIAEMATTGWAAVNESDSLLMFGCAGATSAAGCLSTYPLATTTAYGAGWDTISDGVTGAHSRVLYTTTYQTSWWTRTSPDGRFVAHGAAMSPHLRFIDLESGTVFGADGLYDPSWFPDNSGFMIQGSARGTRMCTESVLSTGSPTMLDFTETGCSSASGVGLYEHLGASLGGGDYWAISGTATYDNGGHSPTLNDPAADWNGGANSDITQITNTGTSFTIGTTFTVAHPYEGDAVISPSFETFMTRQAGMTEQEGYVLHKLEVTGTGSSRVVSTPEIGRYCIKGAKPEFSFDERWMVTHHYIGDEDAVELGFTGPTDPAFAAYRTRGGANVYLVNLGTGAHYRLTNMAAGQYALFPHFRSDGWIMYLVRDEALTPEHVCATDAALLAPP